MRTLHSYRDVASVLGQRTTAEWLKLCQEHGRETLSEIGYDAEAIDSLISDGILTMEGLPKQRGGDDAV